LIKQAVAAGLGVSIVSAVAVEDHVALKRLKVISLRDLKFQRSLGQLKLPGRIPAPAAAVFERLLAIAPENLMVVPPRN
jgi:DNA-binding transcriptional LysR family regulator